jgi:hypothetical protein
MQKGLILFTILVIIFAIPRGFDISDEGVYALLAVPSQKNIAGIFNYDLFFKLFYKITGLEFGLIGLRILRLITCLIAAASLTIFWGNFAPKEKNKPSVFLISLFGVLGSYGFLAQTLSYNSINLMCGCLWLGLISRQKFTSSALILLGITLALLLYSKITVCLVLSVLTLGILSWNIDRKEWIKIPIFLSLPLVLMELIFYFTLGESGLLRSIAAQEMLGYRPDYNFSLIIKYTIVGVFWSSIVVCPFFLSGYLRRLDSNFSKPVFVISLIVLFMTSFFTKITDEVNHVLLFGTLAVLGYLIGSASLSKLSLRQGGYLMLLVAFPFILHFGSNFYFLRLGIHYWAFWLFAILLVVRINQINEKIIFQRLLPVFTLILVFNGLSLYAFDNYRYFEETTSFEYRSGKFIRIPFDQSEIYTELKNEIARSGKTGILPIFRNPGLAYMIGETHPKTPGIWSSHQFDYFYPDSEDISVIFFNGTFDFPFEQKFWREGKTFKFSRDETITIFWKQ